MGEVVGDGAAEGVRRQRVPQAAQELVQLVRGEQVEQHQRVRLLADLVVVDLRDALSPAATGVAWLDVAVLAGWLVGGVAATALLRR